VVGADAVAGGLAAAAWSLLMLLLPLLPLLLPC